MLPRSPTTLDSKVENIEQSLKKAFENDEDYDSNPNNIDNLDNISLSSLSSMVIGSNKSHHDSLTSSSLLMEEHHELLLNTTRNTIASSFNELPNEIIVHILIYMNGAQIIKLECLSKRFYQLIHHEDEST